MAETVVWIGSTGPYLYDTDDIYSDGVLFRALRGDQLYIENPPTDPHEVVRLMDLKNALGAHRTKWEVGTSWEDNTYWGF